MEAPTDKRRQRDKRASSQHGRCNASGWQQYLLYPRQAGGGAEINSRRVWRGGLRKVTGEFGGQPLCGGGDRASGGVWTGWAVSCIVFCVWLAPCLLAVVEDYLF